MDEALLDSEAAMTRFVRLLAAEPDICKVPFVIDSSKWSVIEAGLRAAQGRPIVNSLSLKEGEAELLRQARLARRYGAAVVVMAFDEQGQAETVERRVAIAKRAYRLLTEEAGFEPEDLIFDPNIFAIGTGIEEHAGYAVAYFEAVRRIKAELPGVLTSGGVSNVSFAFRGNDPVREAIHAVFLVHAIAAGLDMAIVNAGALPVVDDLEPELRERVEDLVLVRRPDATERLLEVAAAARSAGRHRGADLAWRDAPVEERLTHALVEGISDWIVEDTEEARLRPRARSTSSRGRSWRACTWSAICSAAGRMFLPQVVKSARVMKQAVAHLMPFIEAERAARRGKRAMTCATPRRRSAGTIVMATVKGDVHDIGKNIVGVVLGCNDYEVIDLGVMVPWTRILETAKAEGRRPHRPLRAHHAVARGDARRGQRDGARRASRLPLLIGGATTSKAHTAVKLEPAYSGPVVHVEDASRAVGVASALLDPATRDTFVAARRAEYAERRRDPRGARRRRSAARHAGGGACGAAAHRLVADGSSAPPRPRSWASARSPTSRSRSSSSASTGRPSSRPGSCAGATPTSSPTRSWAQPHATSSPTPRRCSGAWSTSGCCALTASSASGPRHPRPTTTSCSGPTRRGPRARRDSIRCASRWPGRTADPTWRLSDFTAPLGSGAADHVGAFAVTAGHGLDERKARFEAAHDDYSAILVTALADRLAEAFAERLHELVRRELWGYAVGRDARQRGAHRRGYQGIRPAPGYPACPDHTEKPTIFELLEAEARAGITLTESMAMLPAASVSGLYFWHPQAHYFGLGRIGRDQLEDYARRKGWSIAEAERWLAPNLGAV